nr:ubiquitin conjugating enzyme E2 Z [Hymenolepis microstoma]
MASGGQSPSLDPPSSAYVTAVQWDPLKLPSDYCLTPGAQARVRTDLRRFYQDPPVGIVVSPIPEQFGRLYAAISGPPDTPYEGGFFIFYIAFSHDYPLSPPKVRLLSTGNGSVRFGPNLYANGKVCLSILGTWSGPQWTPTQCLTSVLLSIQSLMNEEPYYNEPGFENRVDQIASKNYNETIRHETLRCAVCDVVERQVKYPDDIYDIIKTTFLEQYNDYIDICDNNSSKDGSPMYGHSYVMQNSLFQFQKTKTRLEALKSQLS